MTVFPKTVYDIQLLEESFETEISENHHFSKNITRIRSSQTTCMQITIALSSTVNPSLVFRLKVKIYSITA